jgi:DNA-directed RNA polymerase specialized sigma24 family protein
MLRYLRKFRPPSRDRREAGLPIASLEETQDLVAATIQSLPPRDRYVLVQIHILRRPRSDVTEELGITREDLDNHLNRALHVIHSRLVERGVVLPSIETDETPAGQRSLS